CPCDRVRPMEESTGEMASLFGRLAQCLAAGEVTPDAGGDVAAILEKLEYLPSDETRPDQTRHRIALLNAAGKFSRVFQLTAPDAPGLTFFGAELTPAA